MIIMPKTGWHWAATAAATLQLVRGTQSPDSASATPSPLHSEDLDIRHGNESTSYLSDPQVITMAPVQLESQISYSSVALAAGHVLAAIVLTVGVGQSLYRSYRALGPAQDTRERRAQRSHLIPVFASLALLSLCTAVCASLQHAILSYKRWANAHAVQLPTRLYGDNGVLPLGENAVDVFPGLWLSDTPFHLDAVEILAERARRLWWGQQIELSLIPWNLFLAIEGRRRNIPLLWCYSFLGQLVSLSYAHNLFFLALLLTPSPLPSTDAGGLPVSRYIRIRDAIFRPKPSTWTPHTFLYLLILALAYVPHWAMTRAVNTPHLKAVVLASRGLAMAPLVLPYVIPASWGSTHTKPHETYRVYTRLFKMISLASFVLHGQATLEGLAHSTPDAYYHRHSDYLPFDIESRSAWERTTSGFGRILGATADHPVVSGAGCDVLLSALSLGLWAAVRTTGLQDILACTVPGHVGSHANNSEAEQDGHKSTPAVARRRDGLRSGGKYKIDRDSSEEPYEPTPTVAASVTEGDVLPEAGDYDWESTALVWGMTILGGLGTGSAGILGGECIAR